MKKLLPAPLLLLFLLASFSLQAQIFLVHSVEACAPATANITADSVTAGSAPGLVFTYWLDKNATVVLPDPTTISQTNVYYIKATLANGTNPQILPVTVTLGGMPNITIIPLPAVCGPETVDLTSMIDAYGTIAALSYYFYYDAALTQRIWNPKAVIVTTSTVFYMNSVYICGCHTFSQIPVKILPPANLVVTDPQAVCAPFTVSLSSAVTSRAANPTYQYSYYSDSALHNQITNFDSIRTSGTYYVKAGGPGCCPAVKPIHVVINSQPVLTLTNPGPVCAPATLNLQASITNYQAGLASGLSYSFYTDAALTTQVSKPDSVNSSGTYYIKSTNQAGCWVVQPVKVVVNPGPLLTVSNPTPVCAPGQIKLSSAIQSSGTSTGLTYAYYKDSTLTTLVTDPDHISQSGRYFIQASTISGCSIIKAINVAVNPIPELVVTDPKQLCTGSVYSLVTSIQLSQPGTTGITYLYFSDAALQVPVSDPKQITVSGTYYIVAQNISGCRAVSPVHVVFNALPVLAVTDPPPVCGTMSVNLNSTIQANNLNLILTYSFYTDASLQTLVGDPLKVTLPGTYYIKAVNSGGCQATAMVHVTAGLAPMLTLTDPSPVCAGERVSLTLAVGQPNSAYTYTYYSDGALENPVASPDDITQTGTFYVKVINAGGCQTVGTIHVKVNALPLLKLTPPQDGTLAAADLTSPLIMASSDPGLIYTYFMDASDRVPVPQPGHITQSGVYYIVGTNPGTGCSSTAPLTIILNATSLYIPTLFTPNGDGINDTFVIKGIESYPDNTLQVFNRWGNKVYEATGYGISQKNWNGSGLLEGTYYYVLRVRSGVSTQTRSGWTMILTRPIR